MEEMLRLEGSYGKKGIRLLRVFKPVAPGEAYRILEMNVQVLLCGEALVPSYVDGDNSLVLPTDTIKNTVYLLAKRFAFSTIEEFAVILATYFLKHLGHVQGAEVEVFGSPWSRHYENGVPHAHLFVEGGGQKRQQVRVVARRNDLRGPLIQDQNIPDDSNGGAPSWIDQLDIAWEGPPSNIVYSMTSGVRDLVVLKPTMSGFEGFMRDKYTTLEPTRDRVFSTKISADWSWSQPFFDQTVCPDAAAINKGITDSLLTSFGGSAGEGTYSGSVQGTVYSMSKQILEENDQISEISLSLPNNHYVAFDFQKFGLSNENEVFVPLADPSGIINLTVRRSGSSSTLDK